MKKKRVVVTGMGLVSCFGTDVNKFFESLLEGKSGVSKVTAFDPGELTTTFGAAVTGFDGELFLDKKQARRVDSCILYGVAAGKLALQNSSLDLEALNKLRAGVVIGSGMGGMQVFIDGVETAFEKGVKRVTPFFIPYVLTNMPGALLAIDLGFKGPNYSVSTACATSNYSIFAAAEHILRGDADVMIAGGVEACMNKMCFAGFSALKAISRRNDEPQKASRPWDKNRDGFVIAEGAGAIVLESLDHALARGATILAEYKGGALTCDAHHMTEPTPDGSDVKRCMELALADAGLKPSDVDYINAHATSTPVGDLCEIRAIKDLFQDSLSKIYVNATKSLIGHALGAAGALEAITCIKTLLTGEIHPTINLEDREEELSGINIVSEKSKKTNPKVVLSNSFGFGGHNSVIILSKYEG
ncbi:MAG: beta-ketoacyl-ACP synthase II [Chlamydiae bacterium]|nr:beta-ketoacyl-ACP synthase II [Chlamydiota bacterium]